MTRNVLWAAAALALMVSLPLYPSRVAAQQADDASAEAEANQADSNATAESSGTADAEQPSTATQQSSNAQVESSQSATSGEAATLADAQSSANTDVNSNQSTPADTNATQATPADVPTSDGQSAPGTQPPLSAPSQGQDAGARQQQERSLLDPNQQPTTQPDATLSDRDRAGTDAAAQGRANVDARLNQQQQIDFRRGVEFGRATNRGLAINNVESDSFFFRNGLRRGDIIVSLHGRPIRNEADFARWVTYYPGQRVPVIVLRGGRQETIYVTYPRDMAQPQRVYANRPITGQAVLGVLFDVQARDAAIIRDVTPGSPAEQAGLQRGDMIVALNGRQIMTYPDAISVVRSMRPGERLEIILERGQDQHQTEAILAGQPSGPARTATRDRDIYVEREVVPAPLLPQDQRIIDRGYDDDRYPDGQRDRPLRRRFLD